MSRPKFKRGQIVYYTSAAKRTIKAIVRCAHRDHTATVEARHSLDAIGEPDSSYIGHRYRFSDQILRVNP